MFTIRLNYYQIFNFILIFCVSSVLTIGQPPKKCAAFNEYCQNHWDCCSNSCISYMYRCSRGYNTYPYPFLGVSYKPTVTLEQILEQNFGRSDSMPAYHTNEPQFDSRFGGADNNVAAIEVQSVLQKSKDETASETTTLRHPTVVQEAITVPSNLLQEEENISKEDSELIKTQVTTKWENHLQEEENGTQKHIELLATHTTTKRTPDKISCAEIGDKCYRNEECCSKLCHGYLHKCVT